MLADPGPDVRIWPLRCGFAAAIVAASVTHTAPARPGRTGDGGS
jgi:hypothetical protein